MPRTANSAAAAATGNTSATTSSGRSKPKSPFAAAIQAGLAKAADAENAMDIVAGSATVGQCKFTQPRALSETKIRTQPAYDIDPERNILDVSKAELKDSCVDSVLAGKHTVTVIEADDDTEVSASRAGIHDSDEEAVANAELVRKNLAAQEVSMERYDTHLSRKNAGAKARRG